MPVLRKRAQGDNKIVNGLFIHSNPPRVLQLNSAYIKQLIHNGDVDKLEQAVFEGQGKKLVGEYSADYKTRTFLKSIPTLMSKISLLHDAVNSDRLEELQCLLDGERDSKKRKLVTAKDETGVGLLHKAVYYDLKDIYKWLIDKHPYIVSTRDSEGRTAYHYTAMCKDPGVIQKMLVNAGADPTALDNHHHSAKYYMDHKNELELPSTQKSTTVSRKATAHKDSLNFKKSNIRIWIHQRNMANLQQVVWEGHGGMLLVEHSNNPKIKRFLEVVPHIMGLIKEIHMDVQNDDLEKLKEHASPPIPSVVLAAKDINGLSPLHKAAGLEKREIAEYIIKEYPDSVNSVDNEGRTPLHYAALLKDDGKMMNFLIENGADESALDNKQKTAGYYRTRHSEIDSKLLNVVPDCPRSAKENLAAAFDWNLLTSSSSSNWLQNGAKKAEHLLDGGKETNEETEQSKDTKENEQETVENGDDKPISHDEGNKNEKEDTNKQSPIHEANPPIEQIETNATEPPENEELTPEKPKTTPENEAKDATEEHNDATEEPKDATEEPKDATEELKDATEEAKESLEITEITDSNNNDDTEDQEKQNEPKETANSAPASARNSANRTRPTSTSAGASRAKESSDSRPASVSKTPSSEAKGLVEDEEGVIEGVVNGENEVEAMNNEGMNEPRASDRDDDVKVLVETGNMEQLATMVLNGEGDRLVGLSSDNPDLQTFLENVPTYMSKIHRIHEAARNGNLRDLQAALDRRKFAIAKDSISPKGASPLHVAVIFGNTSIVRYLAGRFPETLQMVDDDERTPLHYAAVLNDNGHYYNLLIHLGGDMRAEDKLGFNPEYYRKNQEDFNHRGLLRDFGAEGDEAEGILADKVPDDNESARKNLDDPDMIEVLDRCFNVLHGRRGSTVSNSSTKTLTSSAATGFLLTKHVRKYTFDAVKLRLTKLDHNLYDVIWPSVKKLPVDLNFRAGIEQDFPIGLVAPDFYSYKVFKEFLEPVLKDYNYLDVHHDIPDQPESKFFEKDVDKDVDPAGSYVISGCLEATRNLRGFELPKCLNHAQLETVERAVIGALMSKEIAKALYPHTSDRDIEEKGNGTYFTLNEVLEDPSEARVILASNGLLVPLWNLPDSDRLHGKYWPYGRGVFVSNSANLAVWINVLDHLRIVTCTDHGHPGDVGQIFSRLSRIIRVLNEKLEFIFDQKLGFLSSRPSAIGNTLNFTLTVRFPKLIKEPDNLKHLCLVRGLTYHRNTSTTDVIRIGNQQCLGVTELQCYDDFTTAVVNILQLEKDLAMSNSMHIAALFLNIFKKKKLAESA